MYTSRHVCKAQTCCIKMPEVSRLRLTPVLSNSGHLIDRWRKRIVRESSCLSGSHRCIAASCGLPFLCMSPADTRFRNASDNTVDDTDKHDTPRSNISTLLIIHYSYKSPSSAFLHCSNNRSILVCMNCVQRLRRNSDEKHRDQPD